MAVVEYEMSERIATLRLNRPEAKNAIDEEVHLALCKAWEELARDDNVDVVIVTGTGDAFCAGMDLKHYVTEYVGATPQMLADWAKLGLGGRSTPSAPSASISSAKSCRTTSSFRKPAGRPGSFCATTRPPCAQPSRWSST